MDEGFIFKIYLASKELSMIDPVISVKSAVGKHSRVKVEGIIPAESYDRLLVLDSQTELLIQYGKESRILFYGIVTGLDLGVEVSSQAQLLQVTIEGASYSSLLDRELQMRAFQKKEAMLEETVKLILNKYAHSNLLIAPEARDKKMERFTVQYQETDWEFIKRLASRLHLSVVASHVTKGPKFTIGVIWGSTEDTVPPDEELLLEEIHRYPEKETAGSNFSGIEGQYFQWISENPDLEPKQIGDCVICLGCRCYVRETRIEIRNHGIRQWYLLGSKSGFSVPEITNSTITGLSLAGNVRNVVKNQVYVDLDIDALKDGDCWFSYATFYSTFYCMPEKKDRVNLYFPDGDEDRAFLLNSVRGNYKKTDSISRSKNSSPNTAAENLEDKGILAAEGDTTITEPDDNRKIVDLVPVLEALMMPSCAQLIGVTAKYGDSNEEVWADPNTSETSQAGGAGRSQAGQSGSGVAPKGDAGSSFDFESLAINDKIKVLSTADGKMVILNDATGSVSIVCNDGTFIDLNGSNIVISSGSEIIFQAAEEISLISKKTISLTAEEMLEMKCNDSCFQIIPSAIGINATDIKINE